MLALQSIIQALMEMQVASQNSGDSTLRRALPSFPKFPWRSAISDLSRRFAEPPSSTPFDMQALSA